MGRNAPKTRKRESIADLVRRAVDRDSEGMKENTIEALIWQLEQREQEVVADAIRNR